MNSVCIDTSTRNKAPALQRISYPESTGAMNRNLIFISDLHEDLCNKHHYLMLLKNYLAES